jgi:hypothetical protein
MKKYFLLPIAILLAMPSFGQNPSGLTQRENLDPWVYKQGTRPKKGDYGFFLSASTLDLQKLESISPLSFLNFRSYLADDLVLRTGVRLFKEKNVTSGESTEELGGPKTFKNKFSDRKYALSVGIEKHLNQGNLCDVYFASDLRGGLRVITDQNILEPFVGDKTEDYLSRRSVDYGMGLYIGIQTFIADLPLALAVEAGFQGVGSVWQKGVKKEIVGSKTTETQLEVNEDLELVDGGAAGKTINTRKFDLESVLRFNLCYFFSR